MKHTILNFAVIEQSDLTVIQTLGTVIHGGIAAGETKNPSEETLQKLLTQHKPDILIVNSLPLNKSSINLLDRAKLVVCARGNPLNVDVEYCAQRGIMVTCTPGRNANAVAEYTLLMMLSLFRKFVPAVESVKSRQCTLNKAPEEINPNAKDIVWMHPELPYFPYHQFSGREIQGCVLGLIGFGHIGRLIAEKVQSLGMNILVYDPFIPNGVLEPFHAEAVTLETLLRRSDVVSLHAKATKETFHMINQKTLALMKPNAILINTARSTLVDNQALLQCLRNHEIFGAALDVFDYEPLSSTDWLLAENLPNLVLTPHIGGATGEVPFHQSRMIRESIQAFVSGEDIPYRVK